MPAPPEGSEPAIERTVGGGDGGFIAIARHDHGPDEMVKQDRTRGCGTKQR